MSLHQRPGVVARQARDYGGFVNTAIEQSGLIDFSQIDSLLDVAGRDGVNDIMLAFWRSTDNLAGQLKAQIADRNFEEAAKSAHAVKGSAANVGACILAMSARALEIACKNRDAGAAEAALIVLDDAYRNTRSALTAHIDAAA